MLVALNGGKPLPDGALIERDGTLTTDPRALYGEVDGTQPHDQRTGAAAARAMGEHKGSGISFMCELLRGRAHRRRLRQGGATRRWRTNMLSICSILRASGPETVLWPEIDRYIEFVRSARAAPGHDRVRLPASPEEEMRARRRANGVPCPARCAQARAHGEFARSCGGGGGVQAQGAHVGAAYHTPG